MLFKFCSHNYIAYSLRAIYDSNNKVNKILINKRCSECDKEKVLLVNANKFKNKFGTYLYDKIVRGELDNERC